MKYIKTMTQLKLSIWLALYIGWFMNAAVFFRRFEGYAQEFTIWKGLSGAVELIGTFLVTFFLLRILSLFGRRVWRILATIVVLFSAAASYYMTFLNVVIGYGIIASVMTTDIDLSRGYRLAPDSLAGADERAAAGAYLEQPLSLHPAASNSYARPADEEYYYRAAGWPDGLGAYSLAGGSSEEL